MDWKLHALPGLSTELAKKRLAEYGENILVLKQRSSFARNILQARMKPMFIALFSVYNPGLHSTGGSPAEAWKRWREKR